MTRRPATRRPRGSGTVYHRTDGRLGFIARITVQGKPIRKSFPDEESALAWLETNAPLQQRLTKHGDGTLGAWLKEWLENPGTRRYKRRGEKRPVTSKRANGQLVSEKTRATYRSLVQRHWLTHPLAKRPLTAVLTSDVNEALDKWDEEDNLSATTVAHLRRILSAAFTAATENNLVAANPVTATGFRSGDPNRVNTLALTEDLAQAITEAVKGTSVWTLVILMLNTGLRLGEALALDWADVRITERTPTGTSPGYVSVKRAVVESRRDGKQTWTIGPTKTTRSQRVVWFDEDLVPVLMKAYREAGRPKRGLVFPSPHDPKQPDNPQRISKIFAAKLTEKGVELGDEVEGKPSRTKITIRDLRSLHASIQVGRGASIAHVSRRLGHSDPATTLRRYIGVPTPADKELARKSGTFGRRRNPQTKTDEDAGEDSSD